MHMFVNTCMGFSKHFRIHLFKLIRTISYALILAAEHSTNNLSQVECVL